MSGGILSSHLHDFAGEQQINWLTLGISVGKISFGVGGALLGAGSRLDFLIDIALGSADALTAD